MSNKMLIDASHPEETRVAVVRGNRIEEFDFESQEKKQLRGNIYLAKVTRVEPSLQAAFVDYGGNRHGFLAFSEIHPDYYQIPVADRQALLEAEAEDARASREAEDEEEDALQSVENQPGDETDETTDEEKPRKKPARRRSRKTKAVEAEGQDDAVDASEKSEEVVESKAEAEPQEVKSTENKEQPEAPEAETKPKRRSTRRKKAPIAKKADEAPESEDTSEEADKDGDEPTTMAAMVETDSISEPLPEDDNNSEDEDSDSETSDAAPVAEEKPKRRSTRRKKAPVKSKAADEEATGDTDKTAEAPVEDTAEASTLEDVPAQEVEEQPKPKKKPARRRGSRKKVEAADETAADEDNDSDDGVESVGQEDALEEVPTPRRQRRHYKIQEVIKRRQVLLIQVVKEERGTKGAALTTYLSLAGRYSVLMPNTARGGGISRKITNTADRKRLKAIASELEVPQGMGVILRTAGASRTNTEIERDFDYLMRLWEQVRNLTLSSSAPCLVYEEGSLIKRSIRDLYDKDTGEVLVAGEVGFKEAKDFMTMLMPNATKQVKLYREKQQIFAKFGVETQLDKMVTPQVTLKSGGYLIIDQTEALVAVDVNSGRSTREHSIENTALQTNLEAAEEVARQLRLRDLAGLIVIDFIDMEEKRNNRSVEKKLKDCLKNDRARIQVGRISHFGLMEMSRQRMRASVLESTMDVCSLCAGTGHIRSDSSIALHVFRAIEEHVAKHNRYDALIKTTPAIAIHLLNNKRAALLELETRYGLNVMIEGSSDIKGQDFVIEKGEPARNEVKQTAIAFQNDGMDEVVETPDETEEENRGRGRKRGRRNKRSEETETSTEEASTSEGDSQNTTVSTDEEDNGDRSRKKRRRGKRGGRKRVGEEDDSDESTDNSSAASSNVVEPMKIEPEAPSELSSTETAEEKPKARSTVRRKAPVSKPKEEISPVAADNPAQTATQEVSEKDEAPKPRRTTRRKKADEADDANTLQDDSKPHEAEPDNADASDNGEKKKKGWWNRGGGFF